MRNIVLNLTHFSIYGRYRSNLLSLKTRRYNQLQHTRQQRFQLTFMKAKQFRDFWFGLEPDMPKDERKLTILFQLNSMFLPLSLIVTWGLYDWQTLGLIIGLLIQISWQVYFGTLLKRKRKQRLSQ